MAGADRGEGKNTNCDKAIAGLPVFDDFIEHKKMVLF